MNRTDPERTLNDWLGRHRGLLMKVARSFASTAHDRDDLLQEIAFQVWKSIPGYRSEIAETTWLYRVAFYTAINWSRKEATCFATSSFLLLLIVHATSGVSRFDPAVPGSYIMPS